MVFWTHNPNSKYCRKCSPDMRKRKNEYADASRYTIFLRDDFKCVYCGKSSIEDGVKLVLDHINPYIDSKDNSIYNLITSCSECNLTKARNKLPIEIYKRIIDRNIERNKGISMEKQADVFKVLNEWFNQQKN
jgi:5-methylcytosine-specific restriction endonuclease McrA